MTKGGEMAVRPVDDDSGSIEPRLGTGFAAWHCYIVAYGNSIKQARPEGQCRL